MSYVNVYQRKYQRTASVTASTFSDVKMKGSQVPRERKEQRLPRKYRRKQTTTR